MVIDDFRGEIESDTKARAKYSRDASLFKVVPQAVVFPRDASDVQTLVRFANANAHLGVSLTARAAGTDMSGGPLTESIVVDFMRHMHAIYRVGYGMAVVEPGGDYRDFEKKQKRKILSSRLIPPAAKSARSAAWLPITPAGRKLYGTEKRQITYGT